MMCTARGWQRAVVEHGLQVHAVDQPHGHVKPTVDLPDVVDRHDVRIVKARRCTRLAAEPLLELRVLGEVRQQHLQGHHPVDGGVVGAPHLAHAAAAQQLDQLVAAKWRPLHRLTITSQPLRLGANRATDHSAVTAAGTKTLRIGRRTTTERRCCTSGLTIKPRVCGVSRDLPARAGWRCETARLRDRRRRRAARRPAGPRRSIPTGG
jgi:hypothetical protein